MVGTAREFMKTPRALHDLRVGDCHKVPCPIDGSIGVWQGIKYTGPRGTGSVHC
jgi:hypothetical protein